MGADISSRLVDHPQLDQWLLNLQSHWRKGLQIGLHRHQHILEYSLAIHSHKSQLDELLRLSSRAEGLETHPLGQSHHFFRLGRIDDFSKGLHLSPQQPHNHNYNDACQNKVCQNESGEDLVKTQLIGCFFLLLSHGEVFDHVSQGCAFWSWLCAFSLYQLTQNLFFVYQIVLLVVVKSKGSFDLLIATSSILRLYVIVIGLWAFVFGAFDSGVDGGGEFSL